MAGARWAAAYFSLGRDGAEIAPALLAAAAAAALDRDARFDPDALRARLARGTLLGAPA
jgi:hypothetical protein